MASFVPYRACKLLIISLVLYSVSSCGHSISQEGDKSPMAVQDSVIFDLLSNDGGIGVKSTLTEKDSLFLELYRSCKYIQISQRKYWKWYFSGRVYENLGDYESSTLSFLKAERYIFSIPQDGRAWLYFAFERIYCKNSAIFLAFEASKNALKYAKKGNDTGDYGIALCDCACNAALISKRAEAKGYIEEFERVLGKRPSSLSGYYRAKMIVFNNEPHLQDSSIYYIRKYLQTSEQPDYLSCIVTAITSKNMSLADSLMFAYEANVEELPDDRAAYYMCKSTIDAWKENYESAYINTRKENDKLNEEFKYLIVSELSIISERHRLRTTNYQLCVLALIVILVITVVAFFVYVQYLRRTAKYKVLSDRYNEIRNAYNTFYAILPRSEGLDGIEKSIRVMGTGLGLSENDNLYHICEKLVNVAGAPEFVRNVSMAAELNYKEFTDKLKLKDLSTYEVGVCCLLALGFKTSELKEILNRSNVYNRNVDIRNKLGIVDKHISIKQALEELFLP